MTINEIQNCIDFEWVSKRMREHDSASSLADCGFQTVDEHVACFRINIDKNWHTTVLRNWRNCGGKACRDGDDFIAGLQRPIELRACQRGKRDEICARPAIYNERMFGANISCEFP